MGDFKRKGGGYGGHGGGFGGRDSHGGGFDKPQLHQATCASCGKTCEVPFKPNGVKPVFCRDCFKKENGGDSRPARAEGGFDRGFNNERQGARDNRGFEEKRMYSAVCEKCGNTCEVPFRPTGEKPVYCRPCFGKPGGNDRFSAPSHSAPRPAADTSGEQIKAMNAKLDHLIRLLTPAAAAAKPATPAAAPLAAEKPAAKKADKKKAPAKKKK